MSNFLVLGISQTYMKKYIQIESSFMGAGISLDAVVQLRD